MSDLSPQRLTSDQVAQMTRTRLHTVRKYASKLGVQREGKSYVWTPANVRHLQSFLLYSREGRRHHLKTERRHAAYPKVAVPPDLQRDLAAEAKVRGLETWTELARTLLREALDGAHSKS